MSVYSYINSIPYLVLWIFLILLYLNEQGTVRFWGYNSSVLSVRIALFILIFFFGLQCFVWNDWVYYYLFYENLPDIFKLRISGLYYSDIYRFEIGFVIYSSLIKTLGVNYFGWVFLNSIIDFLILYHIFRKYSSSIILSFLSFLVFEGLSFEFNLFRNSKAMLFFLMSIPYIQKRKFVKYFALNLLGVLFHISSLFYLPLYFILRCKVCRFCLLVLFVFSNVIYWCDVDIVDYVGVIADRRDGIAFDKLNSYLLNERRESALSFIYLIKTGVFFLLFLNYKKIERIRESNIIFINAFFIYVILSNILISVGVFYIRITSLFSFAAWIIIPECVYNLHFRNKMKLIWIFVAVSALKLVGQTRPIYMQYKNVIWSEVNYYDNLIRWQEEQMRYLDYINK